MVQVGVPVDNTFHSINSDRDWFSLSLKNYQQRRFPNGQPVDYAQKWQLADRLLPQIAVPVGRKVIAKMVNCSNAAVSLELPFSSAVYPGDINNGELCERFQFDFTATGQSIIAGRYWFVVSVSNEPLDATPPLTYQLYVSEPMDFRTSWPNTILAQYSNKRSDYGFRFDMAGLYWLRIEGVIDEPNHLFEDSDFEDQQQNGEKLYAGIKYEYQVTFGGKTSRSKPVPKWILNKMAEAMRCNVFLLDGKQFYRPANASIDITPIGPNSALNNGVINLHGYNEEENTIHGTRTLTLQFPLTYPFALANFSLFNGGSPVYLSPPISVNNSTELNALIAAAQANNNVSGTFDLSDDNLLTYTLSKGEQYYQIFGIFRTKVFTMGITYGSGINSFNFIYQGEYNILDWGASGNQPTVITIGDGGNTVTEGPEMVYTTTATKTVRLFHEDNVVSLRMQALSGFRVSTMGGILPKHIAVFALYRQNIVSVNGSLFNTTYLDNIQSLSLRKNNTTSISAIDFNLNVKLAYVDFSENALSVSNVNNLLFSFYDPGDYVNGGYYAIKQFPAAAPTGLGLTAKNGLILAGWTVDSN